MKLILGILFSFIMFFSGCASKSADDISYQHTQNNIDYNRGIMDGIYGDLSLESAIAELIRRPVLDFSANSFLSEALIKHEHGHLDTTDALLSSLKEPYYKYKYKEKELWIYLKVSGSIHDFISNLYFVIEGKKINDLYVKLKDVPDGKLYVKDETYVDPWKNYREY